MGVTDTIRQMRRSFDGSTMLMKIIWINIGIFILLRVAAIVCMFAGCPDLLKTRVFYTSLAAATSRLVCLWCVSSSYRRK